MKNEEEEEEVVEDEEGEESRQVEDEDDDEEDVNTTVEADTTAEGDTTIEADSTLNTTLNTTVQSEHNEKSITKNEKVSQTKPAVETTREVDYDTYPTALIQLIERKQWEQAITRCSEFPQEASTWMCRLQEVKGKSDKSKEDEVRWRILPIHSAIVLHAPVEMIEALIEAYPEGLRKGDDRKMLPLHMAFRLGSSPETAAVIVDAYPVALKKKDSRGHTPLHILKAYRKKYIKDRENGKRSGDTTMDINRKKLIKFYLGGRRYGESTDDQTKTFDSDSDSDYDSSDDESYYDSDDESGLFYKDMFSDFARLTSRGISSFPYIMRDTLACRGGSYDLGA